MTAAELHAILLASMRENGDPIKHDLAPSEPIAVPLTQELRDERQLETLD